jgi:ribosomal protein S18 acetylase RimI-like enzyme
MEIRAFRASDQAEVIALWGRSGLVRSWNDPVLDIQRKLAVQPELFLVAVVADDGAEAVVGSAMAGYDGHRAAVYYLAVAPERRGQGIGRALMTCIEERLVILGCPKLNILIRTSNLQVRGFYSALGYVPDDVECLGKRLISDG